MASVKRDITDFRNTPMFFREDGRKYCVSSTSFEFTDSINIWILGTVDSFNQKGNHRFYKYTNVLEDIIKIKSYYANRFQMSFYKDQHLFSRL